jgi:hypothetical protein
MTAPPLKTDPKFGCFPWWPEDGDDWVHPEDVAVARQMIPSERVFRRDGTSGVFLKMHYGRVMLRVRRTLWLEVPPPEFEIGEWVEVLSRGMRNTPRTGTICDLLWDEGAKAARYQILDDGQRIEKRYAADDLRRVEPTGP